MSAKILKFLARPKKWVTVRTYEGQLIMKIALNRVKIFINLQYHVVQYIFDS